MKATDNQILIIFGASGDLAQKKLIPALYSLYIANLLPNQFAVLGVGRKEFTDNDFRYKFAKAKEFSKVFKDTSFIEFLNLLHYVSIDTMTSADYTKLKDRIESIDKQINAGGNYIYYLSTPPLMYETISSNLALQKLNKQSKSNGFKRLIVEKPFGYDLKSAKELNNNLTKDFKENQIFRIDHYLGKETVQNIMVTRFSNSIFEPIWNRNFISHVQITSVEDIGTEGRGGYYDTSGALRDMVQNHLMQLTAMVTMEPPAISDPQAIRNEILKVFQSLRPFSEKDIIDNVIRGQYISSGETKSYREEPDVPKDSKTETFVALKFFIDNYRWKDVPFYIRTGKNLPRRVTEIVVQFKPTPHHIFATDYDLNNYANQLIIRIQPDEGVLMKIGMKTPGAGYEVQPVNLDFHYSDINTTELPTAYERLLLDCMKGDSTLYSSGEAVEETWKFISPILEAWKNDPKIKLHGYAAGTWGPEQASDMIKETGFSWRNPCKNLNNATYCEL